MRFKFKLVLLVRNCDVVLNLNSLIFRIYQVDSVTAFLFILLALSWTVSDVLKRPLFLWFLAALVS